MGDESDSAPRTAAEDASSRVPQTGWKRHTRRGEGAVFALALVATALPMAAGATQAVRMVWALRARADLKEGDPTRWIEGEIRGGSKATPGGGEAVGWAGFLDVDDPDDDGGYEGRCEASALREVALVIEGGEALKLDLLAQEISVPGRHSLLTPLVSLLAPLDERPSFDTQRIPDCVVAPQASRRYVEVALLAGASAFVRGCRRGPVIEACGDGLDAVVMHCEGEPGGRCADRQQAKAALSHHFTDAIREAHLRFISLGAFFVATGLLLSSLVQARFSRQLVDQRAERTA
ncbi:MAG: hypothetical protein AAGA56_06870 [Myxococcota bacterium]